jgi:hypothetical protein
MSKGFGSVPKSMPRVFPKGPSSPVQVEGKATAMNGRREKEQVKRNGKRGQLRQYDPLDFSRFTASENAAGALFQQTLAWWTACFLAPEEGDLLQREG